MAVADPLKKRDHDEDEDEVRERVHSINKTHGQTVKEPAGEGSGHSDHGSDNR